MENFIQEYNKLEDSGKKYFSKSINKLLNEKFITGQKEEDKNYYYFIKNNLKMMNDYLYLIDMTINYNDNIKVIELVEENQSRISLSKLNSIILLILRLLYNQKLKEMTISTNICVTAKEIRDMYNNFNFDENLGSQKLLDGLKILKKYNIVEYSGTDVKRDSFQIIIYPTIVSILKINTIEDIYNKINSYKEVKYEETDENQTY